MAFCTGYAVEMGLLLDVWARAGIDAIAQVDLDSRQNRHQAIADLAPMSAAVLAVVTTRLRREGRLAAGDLARIGADLPERPPLAGLPAPRREAA
jgi:glucosyl-3-phosphoglycerate synthase